MCWKLNLWIVIFVTLGIQVFRVSAAGTDGSKLSQVSNILDPSENNRTRPIHPAQTSAFVERAPSSSIKTHYPNKFRKRKDQRPLHAYYEKGNHANLPARTKTKKRVISSSALKSTKGIHYLTNTPNSISPVYDAKISKELLLYNRLNEGHEARTIILTTVGIINGLIASGAAIGMGGVIVTGLLLLVKVFFKFLLFLVGWIYIT